MTIKPYVGVNPKIADSAYVDKMSFVNGSVEIGIDCSIWPMVVLRGDVHNIVIGDRTNIQDGCVVHGTHASEHTATNGFKVTIGNDVTVGHNATLHGCTIGDRCLIGMGSIVLDGAILENEVMLGAGSLVPPNKVLESGYLWLGNPVKKIRKLLDKELEFLLYSAQRYVDLGKIMNKESNG